MARTFITSESGQTEGLKKIFFYYQSLARGIHNIFGTAPKNVGAICELQIIHLHMEVATAVAKRILRGIMY